MATYAISPEGAAALKELASNLLINANNIIESSDALDNRIVGLGDGLGIYAEEILRLTSRNRNALLQNKDEIIELANKVKTFASEIEQMCSMGLGVRVAGSRSAVNSYQRSTEGGELAVLAESALSNQLVCMVPFERRQAIHASYTKAPEKITNAINCYCGNLTEVCESGYGYDEWGRMVKNGCYYSPNGRLIAMNEEMNDAEYTDVFKHEIGHFVDDMMGSASNSPEFISAMDSTASSFDTNTPEGRQHLEDMLDDAFSTGACFDRNVTDIISALLVNNPIVEQRFASESETGYVANYKHKTDYWHEVDENGNLRNTRGSEIFANLFAIETDQYRISRNFVERWFPEITDAFDAYVN